MSKSGITELLADNIRADVVGDDEELRESLKENGWVEELPALADENGVVLVGHRRVRLAKELGIELNIRMVKFGNGDAADAERVRLAIASNIGRKPMSKKDRERIAQYLYGKKQWTMQRIAEASKVGTKTISRDLEGFVAKTKPDRPKGGRPKGATGSKAKTRKRKASPVVQPLLAEVVFDPDSRVEAQAEARDLEMAREELIAHADALAAEIKRLKRENSHLHRRINSLQKEIDSLKHWEGVWRLRAEAGWKSDASPVPPAADGRGGGGDDGAGNGGGPDDDFGGGAPFDGGGGGDHPAQSSDTAERDDEISS
jgi:ParB-like chromosome segregation protein Spo0J